MKILIFILPIIVLLAILKGCFHRSSSEANTIRAFKIINGSIIRSNFDIDGKNRRMVRMIYAEKKVEPEKTEEAINIIKQVQHKSASIDSFINYLIEKTAESRGGDMSNSETLAEGVDGELLLTKLTEYRKSINELMSKYPLPSAIPLNLDPPLGEDGKPATTWQMAFFHNIPKIATITILNKFESEVRNTEAMCIDRLAKEVVSTEVSINLFKPLISAKSNNIAVGGNYEALIGLGAFSSTVPPEIFVGNKQLEFNNDNQALYITKATTIGTFTVPITIKLPRRSNGFEEVRGELQYTVNR